MPRCGRPCSLTNGRRRTRLRELLYHTHLVQHVFLRMWRGEPRDTPFPTFDAPRELMAWARAFHPGRAAGAGRVGPGCPDSATAARMGRHGRERDRAPTGDDHDRRYHAPGRAARSTTAGR